MNSEALRAGVLQIYELRSFPLFKTISDLELSTLTGRSTRPPTTEGSAPSMPATTTNAVDFRNTGR